MTLPPMAAPASKTNSVPGTIQRSEEHVLEPLAKKTKLGFEGHYNNTALSDMIITFADKQIVGHKIVLSAKSDWFAELCNGKGNEVVDLQGDDAKAIEAMLFFCYDMDYTKGQPNNAETDLLFHVQVYKLADKYRIDGLKIEVFPRLRKAMSKLWDDANFPEACMQLVGIQSQELHNLRDLVGDICTGRATSLVKKKAFLEVLQANPTLNESVLIFLAGVIEKSGVDLAKPKTVRIAFTCSKCTSVITESYWNSKRTTKGPKAKPVWFVNCPSCKVPVEASGRLKEETLAYL